MRFHITGAGLAFAMMLGVAGAAQDTGSDSSSAAFLENVLNEGIHRRASLSQIAQKVGQAQRLHPDDPVPEYAHGLVLLSRVQPAQAVKKFEAALERDPAYLPAWQALLRTRLLRKQSDDFQTESLKLAALVGEEETGWAEESQRREAARWLGRAAGFLALPEVELWDVTQRSRHEAAVKAKLGDPLAEAYAEGQQDLQKDYETLQQDLDKDISQASEEKQKKAEKESANLKDRQDELEGEAENLQMNAEQWKDWIKQRTTKADDQLKKLQKKYAALNQTAQGVSRLIQQTQIEMGRLRTELSVNGIRGAQAEQQPAMIQLGQELSKYQNQALALQKRAAGVLGQGQKVMAERAAAVRRYQKATGEIVQQSKTIRRWSKTAKEASEEMKTKPNTARERSQKKRLGQVASYFELDEAAELRRLIEQAGGSGDDE